MMKVVKNDDELLLLLKQDSVDAYNEIFNRYWKKLYAIAYNRLRSKTASEDVVQDVLVSLWARRSAVEINNLSYYLGAATRYAIFRQINKSMEKQQSPVEDLQVADLKSESEIFESMDYALLKGYIEQEVSKLPEKCQIVFNYSRNDQLSNKEIAHKLNVSEKTIEAHITRAIKHLKVALRGFFMAYFLIELLKK